MEIVNTTVTFKYGSQLDLKRIASLNGIVFKKSYYFPAINLMMQEFSVTAKIFCKGNIVLIGGTSFDDIDGAITSLVELLCHSGHYAKPKNIKIKNLVAAIDTQQRVNLAELYETMRFDKRYFTTFEPEIFPGLIARFKDSKSSATVFRSGKAQITGCTSLEEANNKLRGVLDFLPEEYIPKMLDFSGIEPSTQDNFTESFNQLIELANDITDL